MNDNETIAIEEMKMNRTMNLLAALAATALLGSCQAEADDNTRTAQGGGDPVAVDFLVPSVGPIAGDGQTRSESALPEGATVRILVCSAGESYNIDLLEGNQTYYVKGGRLVPCTVDDNGKFIAEDPNGKISLKPREYDFYVCTPALKIIPHSMDGNIPSITVPQNLDYAGSITYKKPIAFTGVVALNALEHKCARLQLKVNRDNDAAISAMTVKSATLTGFSRDSWETYLGHSFYGFTIAGGTTSATTTAFTQDATNPKLSSADLFLLPCTVTTPVKVTYEIAYTVLGIERTETVSADLPSLTLVEGKNYTLTANFAKDGGIHLSISDWEQSSQDNVMGTGTYPYVQSGNVIVSKDLYGSSGGIFHKSWTTTPAHSDASGYYLSVSPRINVGQSDVGTTMNWATALTSCPSGWRVPTGGELKLIHQMRSELTTSGLDISGVRYWTAASCSWGGYEACSMTFMPSAGTLHENNKGGGHRLRCVQDAYPYVTKNAAGNQCIIVSQDQNGSSGATIHPNWTTTPRHTETSADNSVAAMFELLFDDYSGRNWYIAAGIYDAALNPNTEKTCPDGWRLPTYKEIELIYNSKSQLTGVDWFRDSNYWSSTEYSGNSAQAQMANLNNFSAYGARDKTRTDMRVRCVRDL